MSLEINKLNGVNPFEKSGGIQAATQETKINSVFTHANQTSAAEGTAQNGENAYFTDAVQNGNVSLKKGFLNFGNSYNFKVGDDETLAKFSQKMGLSPEMVMDNIIGGGSDLNCKAPMGPDGGRYISVSEKDLAEATGKTPQELRDMFS
ncbi:hypothetical protein IAC76_00395 [Spirochaetes bacterium]|uniref:Uncharacterized protein n=1 Tax=Candidatus Scatousia excrementipullorum TaxID=2840936 RepID=A0A9D9DPJ0_9BACT|nr:hypothetical protein [Candidatus Scatousia excrementipullorum]